MQCTSILRAQKRYGGLTNPTDPVSGRSEGIDELEWTVFLQGQVMANMMDAETLDQYDGQYGLKWYGPSFSKVRNYGYILKSKMYSSKLTT